jgi:hypothetical protein
MLFNLVHGLSHLVELLWTDIGAVRETKVDQCPIPNEVLFGELLVVGVDQGE